MRAAAIGQTRKHGNRKGMNNGNREQSGCKVFQKTSHALTLIENWQELSHDLTACAGLRRPGRAWPDTLEGSRHAARAPRMKRAPCSAIMMVGELVLPEVMFGIMDASMRSEEHTSELKTLMRISYAVLSLKKKI